MEVVDEKSLSLVRSGGVGAGARAEVRGQLSVTI